MVAEATRCMVSLRFSKDGDARFLGHLDFSRLLERALRRSGLPLRSTQGFNPRLKVAFTDALPLGIASEGEWATVTLDEDLAPETVAERLRPMLPETVRLVEVRRGSAPRAPDRVRYRLDVAEEPGSAADALTALLQRDTFPVQDARRDAPVDARALLARGEAREGHLLVELVAQNDRPPRPEPVAQALRDLARDLGLAPPVFGTFTKAGDAARQGEDAWDVAAEADSIAALAEAAGCSSTPARAPRAG
jgi:radical SAM-linked protein